MSVIRVKIFHDFDYALREIYIGGTWPFTRCPETGKWIDPKTGEYLRSLTLEEALKELQDE